MLLATVLASLLANPANAPSVTVERQGESWLATYDLPAGQERWQFNRSALDRDSNASWRAGKWQVLDDGVTLDHVDGQDMLVATGRSVPRKVRMRFEPHGGTLNADYQPALRFTDGKLALFTGHFDLKQPGQQGGPINQLTLRAPGETILVNGDFHDDEVTLTAPGTYAVIGDIQPVSTPHLVAILDTALPYWVRRTLIEFMPAALEYYAGQMGEPGSEGRPTIMVSWQGATPEMAGLSGNALDGLIAMSMEGEGLARPDFEMAHRMRWFIAHEAAHFWLGQRVQYDRPGDAWIMEGGECEASLAAGTLETARDRGDFRMPYSCGSVLMLGAEAVSGDYFQFARALFDQHADDGLVSLDDWLMTFRRAGASRQARALARAIASEQLADPRATLMSFARATGADYRPAPDPV